MRKKNIVFFQQFSIELCFAKLTIYVKHPSNIRCQCYFIPSYHPQMFSEWSIGTVRQLTNVRQCSMEQENGFPVLFSHLRISRKTFHLTCCKDEAPPTSCMFSNYSWVLVSLVWLSPRSRDQISMKQVEVQNDAQKFLMFSI